MPNAAGAQGYSKLGPRSKAPSDTNTAANANNSDGSGGLLDHGGNAAKAKAANKQTKQSPYSRLQRLSPPPLVVQREGQRNDSADPLIRNATAGSGGVDEVETALVPRRANARAHLRLGLDLDVTRSSVYSMYGFEGTLHYTNHRSCLFVCFMLRESVLRNNYINIYIYIFVCLLFVVRERFGLFIFNFV